MEREREEVGEGGRERRRKWEGEEEGGKKEKRERRVDKRCLLVLVCHHVFASALLFSVEVCGA